MLAYILLIHVVIIHCNIFLPLLLTALSVKLVVLLTLSCVTVPPTQLLPVNHTFLTLTKAVRLSPFPPPPSYQLRLCSSAVRSGEPSSLSLFSLVLSSSQLSLSGIQSTNITTTSTTSKQLLQSSLVSILPHQYQLFFQNCCPQITEIYQLHDCSPPWKHKNNLLMMKDLFIYDMN